MHNGRCVSAAKQTRTGPATRDAQSACLSGRSASGNFSINLSESSLWANVSCWKELLGRVDRGIAGTNLSLTVNAGGQGGRVFSSGANTYGGVTTVAGGLLNADDGGSEAPLENFQQWAGLGRAGGRGELLAGEERVHRGKPRGGGPWRSAWPHGHTGGRARSPSLGRLDGGGADGP